MEERYMRNTPALSEAECGLLSAKRILVAGCGGLGGYLVELTARAGVGFIRAVDGDVFEESNLNRQLLSEVSLLGTPKVFAAKSRVQAVNPQVDFQAVYARMDETNAPSLVSGCDAVLDGLDHMESRKVLAFACERAGIPYIYGAVRGWVAQAAVSMPGDHLVETLYPEGTVLRDKSVLSFTPALCAALQTALCVKYLTGRPVKTGTLSYFDLLNQEYETIPLT